MNNFLSPNLKICNTIPGRAVLINEENKIFISQRYKIFSSIDQGKNWVLDCFIHTQDWKTWASRSKLTSRLLRYYIASFQQLSDGSRLAVARDGVYRAGPGEKKMSCRFKITRGSRPLNLSIDKNRVMFGEYGSGLENSRVAIYVSENFGRTFSIRYQFPKSDIRHVHNIVIDGPNETYWVLVGDFNQQTGIGILSQDFTTIDWVSRGTQRCRAVGALLTNDGLVYGTDSDRERNYIVHLDKRTGAIETLCEIEGSSLYATNFGRYRAISTCVEPNPQCPSRMSSLYLSTNDTDWKRVLSFQKDLLHPRYFQFGTLVLPPSNTKDDLMLLSGQGLIGLDNRSLLMKHEGQPPASLNSLLTDS